MITHIKELKGSYQYISDIQSIYGKQQEYLFVAIPLEQKNMIAIQIPVSLTSDIKDSIMALRSKHSAIAYGGIYDEDNHLTVECNLSNLQDSSEFVAILDAITNVLKEQGAVMRCQDSFEQDNVGIYRVGTKLRFLSNSSYQEETTNASQQYNSRKGNLGLSWLFAIGGMLIGVGIWLIFGRIGFVAGIAGYFMLKFGVKGFEKGGATLTKKRVYIMLGLNVIAIVFAYLLDLAIRIMDQPVLTISFNKAFQIAVQSSFSSGGFGNFALQFAIGLALSVWSSWGLIQYLINYAPNRGPNVKRKNNKLM